MSILRTFQSFLAAPVATLVIAFTTSQLKADIPDRPVTDLQGIYKVAASNDPLFPVNRGKEWFLDFGSGLTSTTSSGPLTVSMRRNPDVSVRMMVWQFSRDQSALMIGNQFARGSRQAVAKGVWKVSQTSDGMVLNRNGRQLILFRPEPGEY